MICEAIRKIDLVEGAYRYGIGRYHRCRYDQNDPQYVAKVHNDPSYKEYKDYAEAMDVCEFLGEIASSEPVIHKGVLFSGLFQALHGAGLGMTVISNAISFTGDLVDMD